MITMKLQFFDVFESSSSVYLTYIFKIWLRYFGDILTLDYSVCWYILTEWSVIGSRKLETYICLNHYQVYSSKTSY